MPETRETVLVRYKDEPTWTVSTTDPYYIGLLRRRGYEAEPASDTDPYRVFKIPAAALTIRSRRSVGRKRESSPASLDALHANRTKNRRSA